MMGCREKAKATTSFFVAATLVGVAPFGCSERLESAGPARDARDGSVVSSGGSPTGGGGQAPSGLPLPPGSSSVPAPSGSGPNFKVLPWAGFHSAVTYTFDDSSPSQVDHYHELDAAGVHLTFYITSSNATSQASVST